MDQSLNAVLARLGHLTMTGVSLELTNVIELEELKRWMTGNGWVHKRITRNFGGVYEHPDFQNYWKPKKGESAVLQIILPGQAHWQGSAFRLQHALKMLAEAYEMAPLDFEGWVLGLPEGYLTGGWQKDLYRLVTWASRHPQSSPVENSNT